MVFGWSKEWNKIHVMRSSPRIYFRTITVHSANKAYWSLTKPLWNHLICWWYSHLLRGQQLWWKHRKPIKDCIDQIADWLAIHNLVAILKRTKTECVLFGTHQRTSRPKPVEIKRSQQSITESQNYENLSVILSDKNRSFNENLERTFKISSRIKLLSWVRQSISPHTAETIYAVPMSLSAWPSQKWASFEDQAIRIINENRIMMSTSPE